MSNLAADRRPGFNEAHAAGAMGPVARAGARLHTSVTVVIETFTFLDRNDARLAVRFQNQSDAFAPAVCTDPAHQADSYISRVAIIGDGGSFDQCVPRRQRCIAQIWLNWTGSSTGMASTRTAAAPECGYGSAPAICDTAAMMSRLGLQDNQPKRSNFRNGKLCQIKLLS